MEAMIEWSNQVKQMLALGQRIVTLGDTFTRVYDANKLGDVIMSLNTGEVLPGTEIPKETALEWLAVWQVLNGALITPIPAINNQTPAQVLFKK